MLKSGVPLVMALQIIAGGLKNPRMRTVVDKIRAEVESGSSLFEALSEHPVQFDELYTNLVKAGEAAGVLDIILDNIASHKERIESIKGKIKKALYYPAAVIAVAIIVSSILLIYVIPQFEGVFRSFGADLPAFTRMVVNASHFMQQFGIYLLLAFIAASVAIIMVKKRSTKFAHFIDRMSLKIPIVGGILEQAARNRHWAGMVATQHQLRKAIKSGNFATEPTSVEKYGMRAQEWAMSNIYFAKECGMLPVIPIDELNTFKAEHLDRRYARSGNYLTLEEVKERALDQRFGTVL